MSLDRFAGCGHIERQRMHLARHSVCALHYGCGPLLWQHSHDEAAFPYSAGVSKPTMSRRLGGGPQEGQDVNPS
ncbi:hypothetical protein MTO96_039942 [Rhipicephalus appendiculatus]